MGGPRWVPNNIGPNVYYDFNKVPTPRELKHLKSLLYDFGVNEKIPEFASRQEMHDWKKRVIKQSLA